MTGIMRIVLMLGLVMGLAPAGLMAHEGHDHTIMGTVTMAAPDHVMLKDKDGKTETVYLKADTKVTREKTAMKVADIKNGMRVVVTAVTETNKGKERLVAKSIALGVTTASR